MIPRVDVSANEGRSWRQAELELPPGDHVLAVRAWDSAGQMQPNRPDETWNFRGYLCTAWRRVPVRVGVSPEPAQGRR